MTAGPRNQRITRLRWRLPDQLITFVRFIAQLASGISRHGNATEQLTGKTPLTSLTTEEQMLRDTVRKLPSKRSPLWCMRWDEAQKMDAGLVRQLFELV